jgi:glycosyltransferase involved in cell wall biosynthesis
MTNIILEPSKAKIIPNSPRIAWLLQGAGAYVQPLLSEFTKLFPHTKIFTGNWPGFLPSFENSFTVEQVGETKVIGIPWYGKSYGPSFTFLPPSVFGHLIKYKPDVVFATGFTMWTILALLGKPWHGGKVIVLYDGSSPSVDSSGSILRLSIRRIMAKFVDAFITNSKAGQVYLKEVIKAKKNSVFSRPYLVSDPKIVSPHFEQTKLANTKLQHPIFLFVGALIQRKGLSELLQACSLLQNKGYSNYTLLVVGEGGQKLELKNYVKIHNLEKRVKWIGKVEYKEIGAYFKLADVFVFPTLEDVWGMVAVEAMMFGKPILCSKWAGAVEMVVDKENGYIFDPHKPEQLAQLMEEFIENPDLIKQMGEKSKYIMSKHTPETISLSLAKVIEFVLKDPSK